MEFDRSGGFAESGVFPVVPATPFGEVRDLDEARFLDEASEIGERLRAELIADDDDLEITVSLPYG